MLDWTELCNADRLTGNVCFFSADAQRQGVWRGVEDESKREKTSVRERLSWQKRDLGFVPRREPREEGLYRARRTGGQPRGYRTWPLQRSAAVGAASRPQCTTSRPAIALGPTCGEALSTKSAGTRRAEPAKAH